MGPLAALRRQPGEAEGAWPSDGLGGTLRELARHECVPSEMESGMQSAVKMARKSSWFIRNMSASS